MDTTNSNLIEREGSLAEMLASTLCEPITRKDMERGGKGWRESGTDSSRFQRFEASRKQGATSKRIVIDGVIRYADKPNFGVRPSTPSPELRAFYREVDFL